MAGLTTGALLCRAPCKRFFNGSNTAGLPTCSFAPSSQLPSSSAWVRLRALRRTQQWQPWYGKKCMMRLPMSVDVVVDDGAAALSSSSTDEGIKEAAINDFQTELESRRDVQEPRMLTDPNQVSFVKGNGPISLGDSVSVTVSDDQRWTTVKKKLGSIISNAQKHARGLRQIRHTLGVDLGDSKTGVAISLKGYAPRPLSVLRLKGDKLIENLLQIASRERADEIIVGLPTSRDGKENLQSNKTRSFAGRLATRAAQRGWRVYLVDEYGSSQDGLGYMLEIGLKKKSRKDMLDAYAALVLLHSYFNNEGVQIRLVVPKGLSCQERLCLGDNSITDFC